MQLGAFSISLAVKDLSASKTFYQTIGFTVFHDQSEHKWCIMKSGSTVIGLFEGMFEDNILTFNPGWDNDANPADPFDDVRAIQKHAQDNGIELVTKADDSTAGPASCMFKDPDGNVIMIDQHR